MIGGWGSSSVERISTSRPPLNMKSTPTLALSRRLTSLHASDRASSLNSTPWRSNQRHWSLAGRIAIQLAYICALLVLSVIASVAVEDFAHKMSRSPNHVLPRRAQQVISFVGEGRLDGLPQPYTRRFQMAIRFYEIDPIRILTPLWLLTGPIPMPKRPLHPPPPPPSVRHSAPPPEGVNSRSRQSGNAPPGSRRALTEWPNDSSGNGLRVEEAQLPRSGPAIGHLDSAAAWTSSALTTSIPVVMFASHVPNEPQHPAIQALRQARRVNADVILVGPRPHRHLCSLRIRVIPKEEFNATINWVKANVGSSKLDVYKWWVLLELMRRDSLPRVFVLSVQTMLYANVTEVGGWLYPSASVALPVRWPSMQPPPLPSQFTSTTVSPHVGFWTTEALEDVLQFWRMVLKIGLFGGKSGSLDLIARKSYAEHNILGWYAYSECWRNPQIDPPCMAEPKTGITPRRAARIRERFLPKFSVESLCQPRPCGNTTWSDAGLCVFDNNFSLATAGKCFKFHAGDKTPQSKLYEHYDAWMGGAPKRNVQFLAVQFQGARRSFLQLADLDPTKSWGSNPF